MIKGRFAKLTLLIFLYIVFSNTSFAQVKAHQTKREEQKELAILQSCHTLDNALMKADTTILKVLLHDKLSLGHSNGLIENKKELLQHLHSGYLKYNAIEEQGSDEVQLVTSTASVRRQLKVRGAVQGKEFEINLKVLETWVMEDKKWQLLNRQAVKKI